MFSIKGICLKKLTINIFIHYGHTSVIFDQFTEMQSTAKQLINLYPAKDDCSQNNLLLIYKSCCMT